MMHQDSSTLVKLSAEHIRSVCAKARGEDVIDTQWLGLAELVERTIEMLQDHPAPKLAGGKLEYAASKSAKDTLEAAARKWALKSQEFGQGQVEFAEVADAIGEFYAAFGKIAATPPASSPVTVAPVGVVEEIREAMGDVLKLSLNIDSPFTLKAVAKFDAALGKLTASLAAFEKGEGE